MSAPSANLRGFWREALLGLALSLAAAAVFSVMRPLFGSHDALRMVLLGCAAAYTLWTLHNTDVRSGRLVSAAAFVVLALVLLAWNPMLWSWLAALVGFVWLLRSLYRHDSLLAAITDAGLSLLALAAGIASLQHNHSLWLALWCFFLTQALQHVIPRGWGARPAPAGHAGSSASPFDQAYRASEAAFARMASRR